MNMYRSPSNSQGDGRLDDKGFTLIEILIAIVLVGILSAVAVVGISNLVSKGSSTACTATADSSKAAAAVYFASNNAYPTTIAQMVSGGQLTLPSGYTTNAAISASPATPINAAIGTQTAPVTGSASWYMTITAGVGGSAPTFSCT
jgi:prepilin-type N-terminal cleavage/methylation domain-containing protein